MTFGAPDSANSNSTRIPSIVILGADALLGALPATPIQLAHACALAGYELVVPASWGDELIAAASLRALRDHAQTPAIQCSCPHVAHRLLAVGADLRPFLISLVAPPVVLARYLRSLHAPRKLRITFVGRCPGAADEAIDARLTPEELLAIFIEHHIVLDEQPQVFDSVIPPDRRRFRSQPGGLPTPEMLWGSAGDAGARTLVELSGDDLPVELAQHLLTGTPVLIDVGPKLGCVCSGAMVDTPPTAARARVVALEPPRASSPVIDESVLTDATLPLPASPPSAIDIVSPPGSAAHPPGGTSPNDARREEEGNGASGSGSGWSDVPVPTPPHGISIGRRHSPPRGVTRPASGNLPTARDADGRQLPRTYVARRRLPARGLRNAPADAEAPIASSQEGGAASTKVPMAGPNEPMGASAPRLGLPYDARVAPIGATTMAAPKPALTSVAEGESAERVTGSMRESTQHAPPSAEPASRYAERAMALPVTRRSDSRPREEAPPASPAGDRPVMQLLTLGLLISMIVLVSAAVGVLVGRWMSQH